MNDHDLKGVLNTLKKLNWLCEIEVQCALKSVINSRKVDLIFHIDLYFV